ncbi:MAG: hypothetical protein C6Y22_07215 [Hapalosiphonaceae cyanobacterium JJU2]|nr:MAG: hypothetical protein C6Y22_07215 [Hapalosiphonaceae cyanobacterium JJU2]
MVVIGRDAINRVCTMVIGRDAINRVCTMVVIGTRFLTNDLYFFDGIEQAEKYVELIQNPKSKIE